MVGENNITGIGEGRETKEGASYSFGEVYKEKGQKCVEVTAKSIDDESEVKMKLVWKRVLERGRFKWRVVREDNNGIVKNFSEIRIEARKRFQEDNLVNPI